MAFLVLFCLESSCHLNETPKHLYRKGFGFSILEMYSVVSGLKSPGLGTKIMGLTV